MKVDICDICRKRIWTDYEEKIEGAVEGISASNGASYDLKLVAGPHVEISVMYGDDAICLQCLKKELLERLPD